jgi:hypothetical protein
MLCRYHEVVEVGACSGANNHKQGVPAAFCRWIVGLLCMDSVD